MGALNGLKVVELAGIGPGPFCGMLLGDMGADVVRIDRTGWSGLGGVDLEPRFDILNRNKRSMALDLKSDEGIGVLKALVEHADILIEPFRPGVAERLGIGPVECMELNPGLIYGRITGWGQDGPLAKSAGHDLNYIAVTGALHAIGRAAEPPAIPLGLVGDFGGGALYLAFGLLCALNERRRSGRGQVVDAAMADGALNLMSIYYGLLQMGDWNDDRGTNFTDGASHFYQTYETKDGKYVAVAAIEPKFYDQLLAKLGLDPRALPDQMDRSAWPEMRRRLGAIFKNRTRDEWAAAFEGSDACFSPVLSMREARDYPPNVLRAAFTDLEGVLHPSPAPRLSRTPGRVMASATARGADNRSILEDWGIDRPSAAGR